MRQITAALPIIRPKSIVVVAPKTEGWFLAGLDRECYGKLGIKPTPSTDDITKERFDQMIPSRFGLRVDFMEEILKLFSVETAKEKNRSFRYFADKYEL